ncbi:hypothetical protein [Niveibacterium terrae]|uniref:hypothetical protein n=1 Tax=Niveibacterium terrae TaxID=3373598 RepID=UPI003A8FD66F
MVFLAITPAGLRIAIAQSKASPFPIWCGADAISQADYEALQAVDLSRFAYPLAGESHDVLLGAIETIEEHHPNAIIWVEHASAL